MPKDHYSDDDETLGLVHIPDHDTSVEAAESVTPTRSQMKAVVYRLLQEKGPMTDQELLEGIHGLGIPAAYSSPGKRRGDLVDEGLVVDSGVRRPNSNGRQMIVWRVADLIDLLEAPTSPAPCEHPFTRPATVDDPRRYCVTCGAIVPTGGIVPEYVTDRIPGHEGDQP